MAEYGVMLNQAELHVADAAMKALLDGIAYRIDAETAAQIVAPILAKIRHARRTADIDNLMHLASDEERRRLINELRASEL